MSVEKIVDYLKIAVIAYVGIYVINRGLTAANLTQFKA